MAFIYNDQDPRTKAREDAAKRALGEDVEEAAPQTQEERWQESLSGEPWRQAGAVGTQLLKTAVGDETAWDVNADQDRYWAGQAAERARLNGDEQGYRDHMERIKTGNYWPVPGPASAHQNPVEAASQKRERSLQSWDLEGDRTRAATASRAAEEKGKRSSFSADAMGRSAARNEDEAARSRAGALRHDKEQKARVWEEVRELQAERESLVREIRSGEWENTNFLEEQIGEIDKKIQKVSKSLAPREFPQGYVLDKHGEPLSSGQTIGREGGIHSPLKLVREGDDLESNRPYSGAADRHEATARVERRGEADYKKHSDWQAQEADHQRGRADMFQEDAKTARGQPRTDFTPGEGTIAHLNGLWDEAVFQQERQEALWSQLPEWVVNPEPHDQTTEAGRKRFLTEVHWHDKPYLYKDDPDFIKWQKGQDALERAKDARLASQEAMVRVREESKKAGVPDYFQGKSMQLEALNEGVVEREDMDRALRGQDPKDIDRASASVEEGRQYAADADAFSERVRDSAARGVTAGIRGDRHPDDWGHGVSPVSGRLRAPALHSPQGPP